MPHKFTLIVVPKVHFDTADWKNIPYRKLLTILLLYLTTID